MQCNMAGRIPVEFRSNQDGVESRSTTIAFASHQRLRRDSAGKWLWMLVVAHGHSSRPGQRQVRSRCGLSLVDARTTTNNENVRRLASKEDQHPNTRAMIGELAGCLWHLTAAHCRITCS